MGLEVEVQIATLYKEASLFGEINDYLKSKDFVFIDFVNLCRWDRYAYNSYGQIAFGDGLWLRSPEYMHAKETNEILSKLNGLLSDLKYKNSQEEQNSKNQIRRKGDLFYDSTAANVVKIQT